ncbi:MAG: Ribosomal RNA large subunit methyltransferase H [Candidatus Dichloromethanomonas elyunquensis]|nr:MAG: Ribosomal RNA large subunit methyltransferase H [Candidatus Dichloromethanomonas elyunquensis]
MLQIKIIAVGKIKENFLKEGIKEYTKRLSAYIRLEINEVDDEPCPEKASPLGEEKTRTIEGEKLLKRISKDDYVILLDLRGQEISSAVFAEKLNRLALTGQSNIAFVIGGSLGTSQAVSDRADFRWSFSKLTFPHQLIRMVLLEQIYRACKINKGEPYHK